LKLVRTRFDARNPVTYTVLGDRLEIHDQVSISSDTLSYAIRNLDAVNSVIGILIDAEIAAVDSPETQVRIERLAANVAVIPQRFVPHVDENVRSDHTDSHEARMIVPWRTRIHRFHAGGWPSKRSTFVAFMAADGFRMKPFVMVHETSAKKELKDHRSDAPNAILVSQKKRVQEDRTFGSGSDIGLLPDHPAAPAGARFS
jgi:hypothetical protein